VVTGRIPALPSVIHSLTEEAPMKIYCPLAPIFLVVVSVFVLHVAASGSCGPSTAGRRRSSYNFITSQCSGAKDKSGYLKKLHVGSK
jgi:hypothetical protein